MKEERGKESEEEEGEEEEEEEEKKVVDQGRGTNPEPEFGRK